jgi:hypothetical protein
MKLVTSSDSQRLPWVRGRTLVGKKPGTGYLSAPDTAFHFSQLQQRQVPYRGSSRQRLGYTLHQQ